MSEKLDGVRAYWNGQTLVSRYGKEFQCPSWFIQGFPRDVTLDGELWVDRGTLEYLTMILQSEDSGISWSNIHFMIFDLPGSSEPYETRSRNMANLFIPNHVYIVEIERCRGNDQLKGILKVISEHGGEGLMMNKLDSLYTASQRTESLLKVKVYNQSIS